MRYTGPDETAPTDMNAAILSKGHQGEFEKNQVGTLVGTAVGTRGRPPRHAGVHPDIVGVDVGIPMGTMFLEMGPYRFELLALFRSQVIAVIGPQGDAVLTGRKDIVDEYICWGAHGCGAFSGKDSTRVEGSAAYLCRQMAGPIVKSSLKSGPWCSFRTRSSLRCSFRFL
jgi:hypothetical protein